AATLPSPCPFYLKPVAGLSWMGNASAITFMAAFTGHQCWLPRNAGDLVTVLHGGGRRPPGGGYKIRRLSRGRLNQRVRSSLAGSVVIVRVKSRCDSVRKDFFTYVFSEFCFKPSTCLDTALLLLRGDQQEGTGVFPALADLPCRV